MHTRDIPGGTVDEFLNDETRLYNLELRKEEIQSAKLHRQLMNSSRPKPMVRVILQQIPVDVTIEEMVHLNGEAINTKRHVKKGSPLVGLAFNDVRDTDSYLIQLFDALMAIFRFELMKAGYYPKPGVENTIFQWGGGMWAESVSEGGELPQSTTEGICCKNPECPDGRLQMDPDVLLKCDQCGDEPLGVVYCDNQTWKKYFVPWTQEGER